MDITTATPVEIDTALAEIYQRLYRVQDKIAQQDKYIEDMKKGLAKKAEGDLGYRSWTEADLDRLQAKRDDLSSEWFVIKAETTPYDDEYARRGGWTRFFHVTNSNGHIHRSMHCSTCFPTTRYAWLVEMSGQSEEQALEGLGNAGHVLCSVCFPNAPVEWFTKRQDPSVCAGSGTYYDKSLPHRTGYYSGNYATCPVCGEKPALTSGFKLRKHKKPANSTWVPKNIEEVVASDDQGLLND